MRFKVKSFRELVEQKETVAFTFGRFNPPTIGHEKLISKLAQVSGSNPYFVFPSQSQNPKKDPLPFALKIAYMRKMFPRHAKNIIADAKVRTALDVIVKLYNEGYKNVTMVVGSDRVKEFSSLLNTYNGVEGKRHGFYKFDNINVVSAGQRDPDADGAEGMSASKMREAALNSDFESFQQGVPSKFRDAKKMYLDVRKNMGIREEKDLGQLDDYESMRDQYLTGKIWNVGDIVEVNGVVGEVVRKGTNYLSYSDESGKINKAWLHEVKTAQDRDVDELPGSQPKQYYKDVEKDKKDDRARHFARKTKVDDDDPSAYTPAPGDVGAKTKPSKHTKKFKQMFGETDPCWDGYKQVGTKKGKSGKTVPNCVPEETQLDEKIEGLVKKAEKSGMPYSILKKVYDRGMAAWRTGHRPGTTPQQWAMARVNSFVTKSSGTWGKADADLAKQVRGEEFVAEEEMKCPPATQDVDINTKNRNSTIKNHMYGPLNVDEPADYWEKIADKWDTSEEAAKKSLCGNCVAFDISPRMEDCMPGQISDGDGRLGYCWMHHFKCHSARTCDTWAKGGPITKDEISNDWQERAFNEQKIGKDFGMIPKKKLPGHEVLGPVAESLLEENSYRVGSEKYFEFFRDKRRLFKEGLYQPEDEFDNIIMEGDLGKFAMYKGEMVALDCPMIMEAEYQGKEVELNKPKAGGPKKYYVYVKDPSTGNIKKVTWGDTTGLKVKLDNIPARKSFAARHDCANKKDKTKAGYWACNLPRYAKQLGLSGGGSFFW